MTETAGLTRKVLIEGAILALAGIAAMGEGYRMVAFKATRSAEDLTGPGRYLFLVGALLALAAASYLWTQYRSTEADDPEEEKVEDRVFRHKVLPIILAVAGYTLLIEYIGYFVGSVLFFVFMLRLSGESWLRVAAISLAMTALYYVLFIELSGMIFPRDALLF